MFTAASLSDNFSGKFWRSILFMAIVAFSVNQMIEFVVIQADSLRYDDLCRWDCRWYSGLVDHGYDFQPHGGGKQDEANWAFFPAFPLAAKGVLGLLPLSAELAAIVASKAFFLLAIYLFIAFAKEANSKIHPYASAITISANPYAIYGNVGYTESMFLAVTCLYFIVLMRGHRPLVAGMIGALLGSIRLAGGAAIPAYVLRFRREFSFRQNVRHRYILVGLMCLPFGLAIFMAFLYARVGDALAFSHVQRAWGRFPGNPLVYLFSGLMGRPADKLRVLMTVMALLAVLRLAYQKRIELAIFSLICILLPLSTGLWAMPRYIWWQAPVLLVIAEIFSTPRAAFVYLVAGTCCQIFMYHAWFSGKAFVV